MLGVVKHSFIHSCFPGSREDECFLLRLRRLRPHDAVGGLVRDGADEVGGERRLREHGCQGQQAGGQNTVSDAERVIMCFQYRTNSKLEH